MNYFHNIYACPCSIDSMSYDRGKEQRHMNSRTREHKYKLNNPSIYFHLLDCTNCCNNYNSDRFSIISRGFSDLETNIKEALLIKLLHPKLNSQLFNNGMSHILNVF